MKVKELLDLNSCGQESIGFIDIGTQTPQGKPKIFLLKRTMQTMYFGTNIKDYQVVSWGVYNPCNFDFNYYNSVFLTQYNEKVPTNDFLVIDIDSRENIGGFCGGKTSTWLKDTEDYLKKYDKRFDILIGGFRPNKVGLQDRHKREIDMLAALYPDKYNHSFIERAVNATTQILTDGMLVRHQTPINTNGIKVPQIKLSLVGIPSQVLFNDEKKATTLIFGDKTHGKPTIVKASKDETYNRRVGFLEAFFQANCGLSKNKALEYLRELETLPSIGKKKEKTE